MAEEERLEEQFTLIHRTNSVGPQWNYRGHFWSARRPLDGDPPTTVSVRCSQCRKRLEFRVQSTRAMKQRVRVLKLCAAASLLVSVLAVIACIMLDNAAGEGLVRPGDDADTSQAGIVFAVILAMTAGVSAWSLLLTAIGQVGVLGNGAGAASLTKHSVERVVD
ncbi:hypothetical protein STSO111631_02595 [Stackebrandtia soli]